MNIERNIEARTQFARFLVLGDTNALQTAIDLAFKEGRYSASNNVEEIPALLRVPLLCAAYDEGFALGSEPVQVWQSDWLFDATGYMECRALVARSPMGFHPATEFSTPSHAGFHDDNCWGESVASLEHAQAIAMQAHDELLFDSVTRQ